MKDNLWWLATNVSGQLHRTASALYFRAGIGIGAYRPALPHYVYLRLFLAQARGYHLKQWDCIYVAACSICGWLKIRAMFLNKLVHPLPKSVGRENTWLWGRTLNDALWQNRARSHKGLSLTVLRWILNDALPTVGVTRRRVRCIIHESLKDVYTF